MAFGSVAAEDYAIERGADAIRTFRSSEKGERWFCGTCGTPLLFREVNGTNYDFSVATLDNPEAAPPAVHIHYASHIGWAAAADDGLPRHPQGRTA